MRCCCFCCVFFFQAEDGIRDVAVTGVQTCALPIYRDNDTCSKGMPDKKTGGFKVNALGVPVTGCPLGEKISEMHVVKRQGDNIGALALVVIDKIGRASGRERG